MCPRARRELLSPEQGCLSQGGSTGFPGLWVGTHRGPAALAVLSSCFSLEPRISHPQPHSCLPCSHRGLRSYVTEPRSPGVGCQEGPGELCWVHRSDFTKGWDLGSEGRRAHRSPQGTGECLLVEKRVSLFWGTSVGHPLC